MLQPGTVIDHYEVERELGGGGMARVYRVRHQALGTLHALKVLLPEVVVDDELRARFLEEGRIQAHLKHPNIVATTDIVVAPGIAGLVMEYLEGESMEAFIRREAPPPDAKQVRAIFTQVLAGVGFAHAHGVIHRDLKPANLFLEQRDGQRVVRVLDFGIAKGPDTERKRSTRTGARLGTPHYMSPEQVRGAHDVTVRSDIFSLGVTLYELATRKLCFDGDSDFGVMENIVHASFVRPEVVHPGIDPDLAAVIEKALAVDPAQRFASCEEFSAALNAPPGTVARPTQKAAAPAAPRPSVPVAVAPKPAALSAPVQKEPAPPPKKREEKPPAKKPKSPEEEAKQAAELRRVRKEVGWRLMLGGVLGAFWLLAQCPAVVSRIPGVVPHASSPAVAENKAPPTNVVPPPAEPKTRASVEQGTKTKPGGAPPARPPRGPRGAAVPAVGTVTAPNAVPARAGAGRFVVSQDTLIDTRSGLTWQRRVSDAAYTWDEARASCEQLGGGWRLPEREALQEVLGDVATRRQFVGLLLGPTGGKVWSASASSNGKPGEQRWAAHLGTGDISGLRVRLPVRALCVR